MIRPIWNSVEGCEEKLKTNSKCFFAFTKSLKKTNSLPSSMRLHDEIGGDRQTVCNLFAKYFNSVFNPAPNVVVDRSLAFDAFTHQAGDEDSPMSFTADEVEKAIKGFDKNKVTSPDLIPMMFFINLSSSLSVPLCMLFNKSMLERKFPVRWKVSFVSPIFKNGDKKLVSNYRPVSVLCAISKIFERLVFNKLFDDVKGRIHHSQHGFFKARSMQTNLITWSMCRL